MKSFNRILARAVLLSTLLLSAILGSAQTQDYLINQFDDPTEAAQWSRAWGSAPQTYEFDPAVDANSQATSGSLKAVVEFDFAQWGGDNQFAVQDKFGTTLDGSQYSKLIFDIRFEANSPKRPTLGDFGYLEYGLIPSDFSQIWLGSVVVPGTNNEWTQVVAPINPTTAKVDQIIGIVMKMWAGDATGNNKLTGTTIFWVDNVRLTANTNAAPPPPPALAIQKSIHGLQLFASKAGSQYQRQSIYTLNNTGYSWVGNANPVTYSVTVTNYPDSSHSGFQTHFFLVPASNIPTYETSPDWNEPNAVFVQIGNNADGSAYASFRYKTNLPNGNSMYFNANPSAGPAGTLATIGSAQVLGTWSVTFSNNTNITLTAPGGASTNFTMSGDAATLFADPLYAYFGVQPNDPNNIGQSAILSRIQITGVATPIEDKFTGPTLDASTWQVAAEDTAGIVPVPPDSAYSLSWTLPANGFVLQTSPKVAPASWSDPGLTNTFQIGSRRMVLVPRSSLPDSNASYFRLLK